MTRCMHMGYVEVEVLPSCNLFFPSGIKARGHIYHFSEVVQEKILGGLGGPAAAPDMSETTADPDGGDRVAPNWVAGYTATLQVPGWS